MRKAEGCSDPLKWGPPQVEPAGFPGLAELKGSLGNGGFEGKRRRGLDRE